MPVKGILAEAAAVVIASLVSAGVTQPAFAAGGTPGSIDTSFGHNGDHRPGPDRKVGG